MNRLSRQRIVVLWGEAAFGKPQMVNKQQRAIRLIEEAIELCQSLDVDAGAIKNVVDYVYGRPVGDPSAELGGVSVCLLALADALGVSADECEETEITRILSKPIEHFTKRNEQKNAAGLIAVGLLHQAEK